MADTHRRINQIRYYGPNDSRNYPTNITHNSLTGGGAFNGNTIVQLGVQTLPGVKLIINNHTQSVIVGATGIYELNVDGISSLSQIQVAGESLKMIESNPNAYIIIDYIYEEA